MHSIFKHSDDKIWLCTSRGLMYFENDRIKRSGIKLLDDSKIVFRSKAALNSESYILSAESGIFLFQPTKNLGMRLSELGSSPMAVINGEVWIESSNYIVRLATDGKEISRIEKI